MSKFSQVQQADEFYAEHRGKPFFSDLTNYMASDVVTGMELVKENAIATFRDVIGPTDPAEAKATARNSVRAHFGADGMRNAIH